MEIDNAIQIAKEAMNRAYSPYSRYKVGAALKAKSRKNIFRL